VSIPFVVEVPHYSSAVLLQLIFNVLALLTLLSSTVLVIHLSTKPACVPSRPGTSYTSSAPVVTLSPPLTISAVMLMLADSPRTRPVCRPPCRSSSRCCWRSPRR